jgi:hypothetical protein
MWGKKKKKKKTHDCRPELLIIIFYYCAGKKQYSIEILGLLFFGFFFARKIQNPNHL